ITTNGPYIEMTAGTKSIGDTVTGGSVELRIRVRAPQWAKVDTLTIYSNSAVVRTIPIPADQGASFETVLTVTPPRDAWVVAEATGKSNMFPVVSPTELPPLDATVIITALAAGIEGLDLSTLPIASKLQPVRLHQSTPYAMTNPIWIDIDGNGWTPPKTPFSSRVKPVPEERPDVRTQFEALQEIAP
nr:hypothetical protein [Deltaproteobacteria bacterium]